MRGGMSMWRLIGGLLVVGAVIFFLEGYAGRGLVLLSPFLLFGAVVLVLGLYFVGRNRKEAEARAKAEADEQARHAIIRDGMAAQVKPLRDRVLADLAVIEASLAREKERLAAKLAAERAVGAPPAKIAALEDCARVLEGALQVKHRDNIAVVPQFEIGSYRVTPKESVGKDWSVSPLYRAYESVEGSNTTWPTRDLSSVAEVTDLVLGAYADMVRTSWPMLVDELGLSGYSARALPVPAVSGAA